MPTILCATDFSPAADRALAVAAKLAAAQHARLELVHVLHVPTGTPPEMLSKALVDSFTEAAETQLAQRVHALADCPIEVARTLQAGLVEETIVKRAVEIEADLVVVGTHGRQGVARVFLGSVAERVIRAARCPVMAVPPGADVPLGRWTPGERPLRITAGIDMSPASDAALAWLRDLRRRVACDLQLVHLYWPPREHERLGLDPCDPFHPDPEALAVLTRELHPHMATHLGTTDVPLHLRALWGGEDDVLGWEAETDEADLLVVGTSQGRHGSTAIATVRAARLPVVCVPGRPAAATRPRALDAVQQILVTTDFSTLGNAAIPQAYRLLGRGHGTVTLLHVAEPARLEVSADRQTEIENCLLALVPRGVNAHAVHTRALVVESDSPGEAIVKAARRVGPDLVVMSSHGRSGLGRALHGSVTEQVLRAAPMPVVVVPAPERAQA